MSNIAWKITKLADCEKETYYKNYFKVKNNFD